MKTTDLAAGNILLPNATIIVEFVIFALVLLVMWRFIVPPILKAMQDRDDMVRRQAEESQKANETLTAAEQRYQEALTEARGKSASIRDEARLEGQQYLDELRTQAQAEVAGIAARGRDELAEQRSRALERLRPHVGELAVTLAGRVLGEELPADTAGSATVTGYLSEQEVGA
ncbi:MAG TPA: F0F1 ATP synthase subunit B [Pseudonocardiaceae bacterium]|jgi:F-type H+-transporting ATPase subunit b|nr:F0F1 ATP synthase subunit B [Pseudonocardiaceae bacterium]